MIVSVFWEYDISNLNAIEVLIKEEQQLFRNTLIPCISGSSSGLKPCLKNSLVDSCKRDVAFVCFSWCIFLKIHRFYVRICKM